MMVDFVFILCLAVMAGEPTARSAEPVAEVQPVTGSAEVAIHYLLSLEHGFSRVSDSDQALLDSVKKNAKAYAPAIASAVKLPDDDAALADLDTRLRLDRALALTRHIGKQEGAPIAARFFAECDARLSRLRGAAQPEGETETQRAAMRNLAFLRRHALSVLSTLRDAGAVRAVLEQIEREDVATRSVMLHYLGAVGSKEPAVLRRLQAMVADRNSPLYNNAQAVHVLRSLDDHP